MADSTWLSRVAPLRRVAFRALRRASHSCRDVANALNRLAAGLLTSADLRAAQQDEWRDFNAAPDEGENGLLPWERVASLRAIRHASPSARVLISAPSGEPVDPFGTALLRAANTISRTDWRAEHGDIFGLDQAVGVRYYHAFELSTLERELRAGGFRTARRVDDRELLLVEAQALGDGAVPLG